MKKFLSKIKGFLIFSLATVVYGVYSLGCWYVLKWCLMVGFIPFSVCSVILSIMTSIIMWKIGEKCK